METSKKGASTIEGKKEEFVNYLENSGVADNLTNVLIALYEENERPTFPTDFIKSNWKSTNAGENEVLAQNNKLREENRKLKAKVEELEKVIERMEKNKT